MMELSINLGIRWLGVLEKAVNKVVQRKSGKHIGEFFYSESLRLAKVGMWKYDSQSEILYLSKEHLEMMGCPEIPSVLPMSNYINNYVYEEDRASCTNVVKKIKDGHYGEDVFENEYRIVRDDGSLIHVLIRMTYDKHDKHLISGITQNITALRETQVQLNNTLHHLDDMKYALDESTSVSFTDVDGYITYVNDFFCSMSGYTRDELLGNTHSLTSSGFHPASFFAEMWETIMSGNVWRGEIQNKHKNGELYWVDTTVVPFIREGKTYQYTSIRTDITKRKEAELKIAHMAYHDALTDLPNRSYLTEKVDEMLSNRVGDEFVSVLLFDLDNFKYINDHHGHQAGDDLLQMVASRLQQFILPHELIARLGGDEFVLAIPGLTCKQSLANRCMELLEFMKEPYIIDNQPYTISLSIGATCAPEQGESVQELLKNADLAMYESKTTKKNSFRIYEPHLLSTSLDRLDMESKLINAIEHQEFNLFYQPKLDAHSELQGFEALIRWQTSDGRIIFPNEFIPLAEQNGSIFQIGHWVLQTAIKQLRAWLDMGLPPMIMGINISPKQFEQENMVDQVINLLEENEIDPSFIELEITEGILLDYGEETISKLNQLKEYGVRLAIDDFGTQYSSLSYLKNYPFDVLKIDRLFVMDIEKDAKARTIIHLIVQLAHGLGMKVTAEGVETEGQLAFLQEISCDFMQGFYFSRPVELWKITEMLLKRKEELLTFVSGE